MIFGHVHVNANHLKPVLSKAVSPLTDKQIIIIILQPNMQGTPTTNPIIDLSGNWRISEFVPFLPYGINAKHGDTNPPEQSQQMH